MNGTCDCCAEQKEGVIYYDDDPNGASLCPECVEALNTPPLRAEVERLRASLLNIANVLGRGTSDERKLATISRITYAALRPAKNEEQHHA